MMKRAILGVMALALLLGGVGQAKAGIAVTFDDLGGQSLGNGPFTLGWQFTVNSSITVTQLGVYDSGLDGLAESHDVGIFDALGNLLTSTTVLAGTVDPLTNQFRYVAISPVTLTPGTYRIGALWLDGGDNNTFPGDVSNFATDPSITFVQNGFAAGGTLSDPSATAGTDPAYFGPNFQFEPAAVPEPASMTMLGIGAVSLVGYGLRRRRQAKAAV